MNFRGFPVQLACIIESGSRANTLNEFFDNILMKNNEECKGFVLDVVPIVLRINVSIIKFD